jgi:hypothetical protein
MGAMAAVSGLNMGLFARTRISKRESGGISHIFEEAFHVLSRCSIIQDAASQSELPANTRIG